MAKKGWAAFPHPDKAFDYAGDRLAKAWKGLHAGDQEPFPDEAHIEQVDQAPLRQRCGLGLGCAEQGARKEDRWQQAHGRSELRPPEGIKHPPP